MAIHKTRNTGTGNGMRGTRGMEVGGGRGGGNITFWGMSSNIPRNTAKHAKYSGNICVIQENEDAESV